VGPNAVKAFRKMVVLASDTSVEMSAKVCEAVLFPDEILDRKDETVGMFRSKTTKQKKMSAKHANARAVKLRSNSVGGTPTLNIEWHAGAETDGDAAQPLPLSKADLPRCVAYMVKDASKGCELMPIPDGATLINGLGVADLDQDESCVVGCCQGAMKLPRQKVVADHLLTEVFIRIRYIGLVESRDVCTTKMMTLNTRQGAKRDHAEYPKGFPVKRRVTAVTSM